MKQRKFLSRNLLVSLVYLLFFILFIFLIVDGYLNLNRDLRIYTADSIDMINQRMSSILFELNAFPQYTGKGILFVTKLSSLRKIISDGAGVEDDFIKDLEEDFLEFLKQSNDYYHLSYIDEGGDEVVKVEFDGRYHAIIQKDKLKNEGDTDCFRETIALNEGEIFISQLDLDMNGEKSDYIPVIKTATPVFDKDGARKGVVFLSFYTDYFLKDIRRLQRGGEKIFLINKEGYYLANSDEEKEFAFVFGGNDNFYNDYPEVSKEVLLDFSKRKFESENLIFSFRHIYPTVGDFWVYKSQEKFFGESLEKDYFWILVSVSGKEEINNMQSNLKKDYLYFLLFLGIIMAIMLVLIFILFFRGKK